MKIYLIRHGQTTGDVEDRYGGDYDDHLNEEGKRQSQELADKLSSAGIQKIFASPKIRAQETATILAKALNVPVETVNDFRERNHYGGMTGMTKAEARAQYPDLVELLNDTHNTITGGEAYEPFKERVTDALKALMVSSAECNGIVTHGGPIRTIFREILRGGEIDIADCAFAELEASGGGISLVSVGGISYK